MRIPPEEAPRPLVRAIGWIVLACLVLATLVGDGGLWPEIEVLYLPGGLLMMLQALALGGRRAFPFTGIRATRALPPVLFTCGVGVAGGGLEHLDPARAWSALQVPMIAIVGLWFLRHALRGEESELLDYAPSRPHALLMRAGMWLFGLLWPILALDALGLYELD